METYLHKFVLDGGPLMVVLLPCSVILIAVIVQSMIYLNPRKVLPPALLKEARAARDKNARVAFVMDLRKQSSPLSRTLRLTFKELNPGTDQRPSLRQIEPVIRNSAAHVADDLYERMGAFATLYTIAPLLGLMGTILGMMNAFSVFGSQEAKELSLLSKDIQQALVTTLWGLGIAISAFVAAQIFQAKIRRFEREDLPETAVEIIDAIYRAPADADARSVEPMKLKSPPAAAQSEVPTSAP